MSKQISPASLKVSILLLCWNHANYLEECIASIATQTSRNFEIIFLDNVSSDGSFQIADKLFKKYDLSAKMLCNAQPQLVSTNLNRLLKESTCDLVAVLSTDDWYAPNYVELVSRAAELHSQSKLIATNGWSVIADGAKVQSKSPTLKDAMVGDRFLFEQDFFFWVGLCYRREALIAIGGWDSDQTVEDIDLLFRLTRTSPVTQLAERLVYYRRSESSISLNPVFMADGRLKFFQKHRAHFGKQWRDIVSEMLRSSAAVAIDQDRKWGSARLLLRSLTIRPFTFITWKTVFYLIRATARRHK